MVAACVAHFRNELLAAEVYFKLLEPGLADKETAQLDGTLGPQLFFEQIAIALGAAVAQQVEPIGTHMSAGCSSEPP